MFPVKRKKSDVRMFRDACVTACHELFTYKMANKMEQTWLSPKLCIYLKCIYVFAQLLCMPIRAVTYAALNNLTGSRDVTYSLLSKSMAEIRNVTDL